MERDKGANILLQEIHRELQLNGNKPFSIKCHMTHFLRFQYVDIVRSIMSEFVYKEMEK